jgi:hypothetical protein
MLVVGSWHGTTRKLGFTGAGPCRLLIPTAHPAGGDILVVDGNVVRV